MRFVRFNELENNSKTIFWIGKILRYPYIRIQSFLLEIVASMRRRGMVDKRYEKIKTYERKFEGKRCFVVATGPSLTLDDIKLLDNEYTFAMNSICKLYPDTDWRPSFYGIQDENVYAELEEILKKEDGVIFASSNLARRFSLPDNFIVYPLNSKYNYFDFRYSDKLHVKFSSNSYSEVYDAYSITFSLLQIAIYMGFKEIYLIGADCNQKVGQKNHFIDMKHVENGDKLLTSAKRNIFSHAEFYKFAKSKNIKIYNATRGGALEVYPRVTLEEVLARGSI